MAIPGATEIGNLYENKATTIQGQIDALTGRLGTATKEEKSGLLTQISVLAGEKAAVSNSATNEKVGAIEKQRMADLYKSNTGDVLRYADWQQTKLGEGFSPSEIDEAAKLVTQRLYDSFSSNDKASALQQIDASSLPGNIKAEFRNQFNNAITAERNKNVAAAATADQFTQSEYFQSLIAKYRANNDPIERTALQNEINQRINRDIANNTMTQQEGNLVIERFMDITTKDIPAQELMMDYRNALEGAASQLLAGKDEINGKAVTAQDVLNASTMPSTLSIGSGEQLKMAQIALAEARNKKTGEAVDEAKLAVAKAEVKVKTSELNRLGRQEFFKRAGLVARGFGNFLKMGFGLLVLSPGEGFKGMVKNVQEWMDAPDKTTVLKAQLNEAVAVMGQKIAEIKNGKVEDAMAKFQVEMQRVKASQAGVQEMIAKYVTNSRAYGSGRI